MGKYIYIVITYDLLFNYYDNSSNRNNDNDDANNNDDDSWKNRCAPADSLVFADSLSSLSLE